ncbi:MAG: D-alanyl-D-alanine carboxypeptidase [Pelotomaculum sp. PtaB.Bin013]|uniref:D-alanyl-D-alanine carboxypeptidase family protein n=1 Tax=Pelotomaculum isophthalicicum JI TaxID=947010 RepID=A0A9X4H274_9FIRM|nr:D-alanyl-D-alanine carboxypeptidase family protein [Pelotomaculum isophthalicicum]MDF9408721.1 D-alanyl-D-alanine carboxypeptidase family protein [Pelotomaculum isophthalicicum JI]OPX83395.1 MAG: D-alanyl-D-alanine carboxypeptidase [Pelotomaculum sp. PtaB.Bin013]
MRKILISLLTLFLITFYTQAYTSPENKAVFQLGNDKFTLNNQEQSMDTIPIVKSSRVFVPIRYIAYACGIDDKDILWDMSTQTVTLNSNNKRLSAKVGSKQLVNNGHVVDMDVAPVMINDRVFLPARWIAEAYNYKIEWDQASKSILIYPRGNIKPHPPEQPAVLLVNKTHRLPDDYHPDPLDNYNGYQVSKSMNYPLQALFTAADEQSINLGINSGYRDVESQQQIFNERVSQLGLQEAKSAAALPGYSEHQTGLAVDLEGDSNAYSWLKANCWSYGFILRYPKGGEEITGYSYEPWHFRYVGIPIASFMHANNIQTLEEFIDTYISD